VGWGGATDSVGEHRGGFWGHEREYGEVREALGWFAVEGELEALRRGFRKI